MTIKNKLLTAKLFMRAFALFVILFLVSASILYFYDTLVSGFSKLKWHGETLFPQNIASYLSATMAIIIGIGILAESAPTIWDKLMYWGQVIDNIMIKALTRKEFFLTKANRLLEETRLLINKTNFHLQAIMIPTDHSYDNENTDILCENIKKIKNNCQKINTLLENHQAEDTLHRQAQEKAKQTLNTLVTENLELSERIEKLSQTSGV